MTTKYAAASYASAGFTAADFNSLASGSCVVASSAIANGTARDVAHEVSFALTVGGTTTAASYLVLYILPLNQDATTYGDGTASGAGATPPTSGYQAAVVSVKSGVTSGNVITGTFPQVPLPNGDFKYAIAAQLGVALNASAVAAVQYRAADIDPAA